MKDPSLIESLFNQLFLKMDSSQSSLSARIQVVFMVIPGVSAEAGFEAVLDLIETILHNLPKDEIPKISIFLSFHEFP